MDIEIGKEGDEHYAKGRIVIELFKEQVPKTVENFRALSTGELQGRESNLHYKTRIFNRIVPGFMMQGGDIATGNGTGAQSIYGTTFDDESNWIPHSHAGLVSSANHGPNTNGSQFFILFGKKPNLDGKHNVFGRVIHGFMICLDAQCLTQTKRDIPDLPVVIVDCGELEGGDKLTEDKADYLYTYSKEDN